MAGESSPDPGRPCCGGRLRDRLPSRGGASRDPDRPNLVVVVSDDQGHWALGCAGNPEISTPRLDGLAASGTRVEHFFCTSPVCSPARASLFTGSIPSQHGVHDAVHAGHVGPDAVDYLQGAETFVQILAGAGFHCRISGKWHLGDAERPRSGFAHWYVHQTGGGPYHDAPMVRDGRLVEEPGYVTDAITDEALRFVTGSARDDRPFCLVVAYTAPHAPWVGQHPQRFLDLYDDCAFASCPQEDEHPWVRGFRMAGGGRARVSPAAEQAAADPRPSLLRYFAAVTAMDEAVGRILDRLDREGLRTSTLVAFLSDNGFNAGHHGIWGKGNGTFPLNVYDTSVRVPAIFSQPGRVAARVEHDALLSGYDLYPTLLDLAGLGEPKADGPPSPGASFAALLRSGALRGERDHVVVFDEYGPVRMLRTRAWKYVHRHPYGPHELYDLANDPWETANLVEGPARRTSARTCAPRWRTGSTTTSTRAGTAAAKA